MGTVRSGRLQSSLDQQRDSRRSAVSTQTNSEITKRYYARRYVIATSVESLECPASLLSRGRRSTGKSYLALILDQGENDNFRCFKKSTSPSTGSSISVDDVRGHGRSGLKLQLSTQHRRNNFVLALHRCDGQFDEKTPKWNALSILSLRLSRAESPMILKASLPNARFRSSLYYRRFT